MSELRGAIYPAAQLHAWLDAHRSDPKTLDHIPLRLPVLVTLTSNRMDVERATVGDRADALVIAIDDRTLNIPIAGKLPAFFGEGADRGMLWLHGLWRGGDALKFQVTKVEGPIEGADRAAAMSAAVVQ